MTPSSHPLLELTRAGRRKRRQVFNWFATATSSAIRAGLHSEEVAVHLVRAADTMLLGALAELDRPFAAPSAGPQPR